MRYVASLSNGTEISGEARTAGQVYRAIGAACGWPLLNLMYLLIGIRFVHRRLLPGELLRWYTVDIGHPLAGALIGGMIGFLIPAPDNRVFLVGKLGMVVVLSSVLAALATPVTRVAIRKWVRERGWVKSD